jgi:hypothetical protein
VCVDTEAALQSGHVQKWHPIICYAPIRAAHSTTKASNCRVVLENARLRLSSPQNRIAAFGQLGRQHALCERSSETRSFSTYGRLVEQASAHNRKPR